MSKIIRLSKWAAAGLACFASAAHSGVTLPISLPGGASASGVFPADVSTTPDGQLVCFVTNKQLVSGAEIGNSVYLLDRGADVLELINEVSDPDADVNRLRDARHPQITDDGRFVSFEANASSSSMQYPRPLVWIKDRDTGAVELGSAASGGTEAGTDIFSDAARGSITRDGSAVVFASNFSGYVAGDSNEEADVFLYDRSTLETTRVSLRPDASEPVAVSVSPVPSLDGRYVLFTSYDSGLVANDENDREDLFLAETETVATVRANVGRDGEEISGGYSAPKAISGDGRYVVFGSRDAFASPGDDDVDVIGVFDRTRGVSTPFREFLSIEHRNVTITLDDIVMSDDGRLVAFTAIDLLPVVDRRSQSEAHLYLADTTTDEIVRIDQGAGQEVADAPAVRPVLSQETGSVIFLSGASNLGGDASTILYERIPGVSNTTLSILGPAVIEPSEGIVDFSITLTNQASNVLSDGYVVITQPLFGNFDASVPGGHCEELDSTSVTHCLLPELAPAASATVTLEVDPSQLSPITDHEFLVTGGSIGNFDVAPSDNRGKKTISIAGEQPGPGPPGPSGGGGGGGGACDLAFLFALLGAWIAVARRRALLV